MTSLRRLGIYDYVVIGTFSFISLAIGIRFYFINERENTSRNFMLAGNDVPKLVIVLSMIVTIMSAIMMIGAPVEIYLYGAQFSMMTVGFVVGVLVSSYLFLPVYFKVGTRTIFEVSKVSVRFCSHKTIILISNWWRN